MKIDWTWPDHPKRWTMRQTWNDLLFLHWSFHVEDLQRFIPSPLRLDTYQGKAWISIVPFYMSNIQIRQLPGIPLVPRFPELNVRTYVIHNDIPGVYFFSLDAANWLAVEVAKTFIKIPYYYADQKIKHNSDQIDFYSKRMTANTDKPIEFSCTYRPISNAYTAGQGTLDYWLTERYCFYTQNNGHTYRGDIYHEPWLLQQAEAAIHSNSMLESIGLTLPNEQPLIHYAKRLDIVARNLIEV